MASYFKSLSMIMMTSNKTKEEWRVIKNLLDTPNHGRKRRTRKRKGTGAQRLKKNLLKLVYTIGLEKLKFSLPKTLIDFYGNEVSAIMVPRYE